MTCPEGGEEGVVGTTKQKEIKTSHSKFRPIPIALQTTILDTPCFHIMYTTPGVTNNYTIQSH